MDDVFQQLLLEECPDDLLLQAYPLDHMSYVGFLSSKFIYINSEQI